jgi:hypothetical protein
VTATRIAEVYNFFSSCFHHSNFLTKGDDFDDRDIKKYSLFMPITLSSLLFNHRRHCHYVRVPSNYLCMHIILTSPSTSHRGVLACIKRIIILTLNEFRKTFLNLFFFVQIPFHIIPLSTETEWNFSGGIFLFPLPSHVDSYAKGRK